jgi:hypothetical protein
VVIDVQRIGAFVALIPVGLSLLIRNVDGGDGRRRRRIIGLGGSRAQNQCQAT